MRTVRLLTVVVACVCVCVQRGVRDVCPGVCVLEGGVTGGCTPLLWSEWQTSVKTLPSRNIVAGGKKFPIRLICKVNSFSLLLIVNVKSELWHPRKRLNYLNFLQGTFHAENLLLTHKINLVSLKLDQKNTNINLNVCMQIIYYTHKCLGFLLVYFIIVILCLEMFLKF